MKEIIESKFEPSDYPIVVVDFWADWCMPCKMLMPLLTKLSKEISNVTFLKANVEENTDLAKTYNVTSIPSIVIFKDGVFAEKLVGLQTEAKIKEAIQKVSS